MLNSAVELLCMAMASVTVIDRMLVPTNMNTGAHDANAMIESHAEINDFQSRYCTKCTIYEFPMKDIIKITGNGWMRRCMHTQTVGRIAVAGTPAHTYIHT